jgi:Got1/Sft2-like family
MFDSVDLNSLLPRSSHASVSFDEPSGRGSGNGNAGSAQDDEESWCTSLTWQERLIGCGACMVLGYLLSFGSFFRFKDLLLGNPLPFVIHTTMGNIIALAGSCFLTGPASQYNRMMHDKRKYATVAYLGSLSSTLLVAFLPVFLGKALLLVLLLLVQYVAITWYCLSYIPYAREAIQAYINRMFQSVDG